MAEMKLSSRSLRKKNFQKFSLGFSYRKLDLPTKSKLGIWPFWPLLRNPQNTIFSVFGPQRPQNMVHTPKNIFGNVKKYFLKIPHDIGQYLCENSRKSIFCEKILLRLSQYRIQGKLAKKAKSRVLILWASPIFGSKNPKKIFENFFLKDLLESFISAIFWTPDTTWALRNQY